MSLVDLCSTHRALILALVLGQATPMPVLFDCNTLVQYIDQLVALMECCILQSLAVPRTGIIVEVKRSID